MMLLREVERRRRQFIKARLPDVSSNLSLIGAEVFHPLFEGSHWAESLLPYRSHQVAAEWVGQGSDFRWKVLAGDEPHGSPDRARGPDPGGEQEVIHRLRCLDSDRITGNQDLCLKV